MNASINNAPPLLDRFAFAIVRGGAASVEVFLHKRFGVRYLSTFGAAGATLMIVYLAFVPVDELGPFAVYMFAYFVSWFLTTVETWLRFWRGDNEHSGYGGFPRCLRRRLAHKEYKVKQFFEPLLVGCIGYWTFEWNQPLGVYWIFAAACLFISNAQDRRYQTRDALVLHDAALEQQQRAQRFREIHGVPG